MHLREAEPILCCTITSLEIQISFWNNLCYDWSLKQLKTCMHLL